MILLLHTQGRLLTLGRGITAVQRLEAKAGDPGFGAELWVVLQRVIWQVEEANSKRGMCQEAANGLGVAEVVQATEMEGEAQVEVRPVLEAVLDMRVQDLVQLHGDNKALVSSRRGYFKV